MSGNVARLLVCLAGALAVSTLVSCEFDSVHQSEVDALGPERPGISRGPYHRAGQPCTVCHGAEGPSQTHFTLAGTVFASRDQAQGMGQVELLLVDSLGSSPTNPVLTNCVGNFYLTADAWNPAFPVRVAVASGQATAPMIGHIGRAGSCASCHKDPRGLDSPGHVFVGTTSPAPSNCPVDPNLGGP